MKKQNVFTLPIFLLLVLCLIIVNMDKITDYTVKLVATNPSIKLEAKNEYALNNNFRYIKKTDYFVPYSKQDLMNIFYSILDNGYTTFSFYCPSEYTDCLKDISAITSNQTLITNIGNFVHPYNNFSNVKVVTDSLGEVDILVTKLYTEDKITYINNKLDEIFNEVIKEDMSLEDKILALHDYIIDTTKYDEADNEDSGNAYGLLYNGLSKCSGYADVLGIILNKLNVKNYKVASEAHVWNALLINDEWMQIDLTWDDPIVEGNVTVTDNIRHKFYMIDTPTLLSYDTLEHDFDSSVYREIVN